MLLSDKQLEQVEKRVLESGLKNHQLQLDLIDHIACTIEEMVEKGETFDYALEITFKLFSQKQIMKIEHTTNILTKDLMRTHTKILGIIGLLIVTAGATLKVLHISGASLAMVFGVAVLGIGFFGSNAIDTIKNIETTKGRIVQLIGAFGAFLTITGGMLKLLHLPGALVLMISGPSLLLIYFSLSSFIRTRMVE